MRKSLTLGAVGLTVIAGNAGAIPMDIIDDSTTDKGPNFVGPNTALGNGDSQASGTLQFGAVANWFNLHGTETLNFGQDNDLAGSP